VTDVTANSARLTWNSGNADPVQSYVVQYRHKYSSDGLYDEIFDVAASEYTVLGLAAHTVYEFRVVAVNAIGRSLPSSPVDVTTGELGMYQPAVTARQQRRRKMSPRESVKFALLIISTVTVLILTKIMLPFSLLKNSVAKNCSYFTLHLSSYLFISSHPYHLLTSLSCLLFISCKGLVDTACCRVFERLGEWRFLDSP